MNDKKEVGHKKHVLRRIVLGAAIVTGVAFAGVLVSVAAAVPNVMFTSVSTSIGAVSAALGIGAGANLIYTKRQENKYRKKSLNAIKQISEVDSDKSATMSKSKRISLAKKFAKANIKLCKLAGCPFCGRFRSNSTLTEKENERFNREQNEALLIDIENAERENIGVSKKLKYKSKLKLSSESVRNRLQVWTKEYNSFLKDVSIKDRRIEIGCLCDSTTSKFEKLVKDIPATSELGGMVNVAFEGSSPIKQTYARVTDKGCLERTKDILLEDVYNACKNSTEEKKKAFFPFTIETRDLNDKAKVTNVETTRIKSFEDLCDELNIITNDSVNEK